MLSAREALERLREGNRRFVSGAPSAAIAGQRRRSELLAGQEPFAVIVGCSDSRVPPEIVFDHGLGELFVVRVAGNIVQPSAAGSVEYAVQHLSTRLVVVLGHTKCGAVGATLDELRGAGREQSANLRSIVDGIRPSVEPLLAADVEHDPEEVLRQAIRANVRRSVAGLCTGSSVIEREVARGGALVVGAEYSLESGEVDFFDGLRGVEIRVPD